MVRVGYAWLFIAWIQLCVLSDRRKVGLLETQLNARRALVRDISDQISGLSVSIENLTPNPTNIAILSKKQEMSRQLSEEKRVESENVRTANEMKRIANDLALNASEQQRVASELERIANESARQIRAKEKESIAVGKAQADLECFNKMVRAEVQRVAEEIKRQQQEALRVDAEQMRIDQEFQEMQREIQRQAAEVSRTGESRSWQLSLLDEKKRAMEKLEKNRADLLLEVADEKQLLSAKNGNWWR